MLKIFDALVGDRRSTLTDFEYNDISQATLILCRPFSAFLTLVGLFLSRNIQKNQNIHIRLKMQTSPSTVILNKSGQY